MTHEFNIHVDDDFGRRNSVPGISSYVHRHGKRAIVDQRILMGHSFWRPIELLLKIEKRYKNLSSEEFIAAFEPLRDGEADGERIYYPDTNPYDLQSISRCHEDRILIQYQNCHLSNIYAMDYEGDHVEIQVTPDTKSYFTMGEWEWRLFVERISEDKQTRREDALNELLSETSAFTDIIRRLRYKISHGRSNSFERSVYDFYDKRGYITEKQAQALLRCR